MRLIRRGVLKGVQVDPFLHHPSTSQLCDLSRRALSQDQRAPRWGATVKMMAKIVVATRTIDAPEETLT